METGGKTLKNLIKIDRIANRISRRKEE